MQDFKDLNPNFLGVALKWLCIFVLVIIVIMVLKGACNKLRSPEQDQVTVIVPPVVRHYSDDSGKQHTEVAAIVAPVVNNLDVHYKHVIDSLTKVIKATPKSMQSAVLVGTETKGNFIPILSPPVKKDSSSELLFYSQNTKVDWHDKFITIHGVLDKDSNWS